MVFPPISREKKPKFLVLGFSLKSSTPLILLSFLRLFHRKYAVDEAVPEQTMGVAA